MRVPIKIYRERGNCLACTPTPVLTALITGRNYLPERYQKKECWLKMCKIIEERDHLCRFIQEIFSSFDGHIFLEQLAEML